ncbi:hypothetical protein AAFF_G00106180 [Aldrovandia affinis]|uniref:Uncharacterized protein n=1 Tax=Aldrovandia affinis TaxID=143900 RepID=A0AAD7WXA9_9TELE|nr:hypothetical protein AAFF_G00106180 [Aldrovandia affinis]
MWADGNCPAPCPLPSAVGGGGAPQGDSVCDTSAPACRASMSCTTTAGEKVLNRACCLAAVQGCRPAGRMCAGPHHVFQSARRSFLGDARQVGNKETARKQTLLAEGNAGNEVKGERRESIRKLEDHGRISAGY